MYHNCKLSWSREVVENGWENICIWVHMSSSLVSIDYDLNRFILKALRQHFIIQSVPHLSKSVKTNLFVHETLKKQKNVRRKATDDITLFCNLFWCMFFVVSLQESFSRIWACHGKKMVKVSSMPETNSQNLPPAGNTTFYFLLFLLSPYNKNFLMPLKKIGNDQKSLKKQ